jgi:hypothetical protein
MGIYQVDMVIVTGIPWRDAEWWQPVKRCYNVLWPSLVLVVVVGAQVWFNAGSIAATLLLSISAYWAWIAHVRVRYGREDDLFIIRLWNYGTREVEIRLDAHFAEAVRVSGVNTIGERSPKDLGQWARDTSPTYLNGSIHLQPGDNAEILVRSRTMSNIAPILDSTAGRGLKIGTKFGRVFAKHEQ